MTRPELEARRLQAIPDLQSKMTRCALAKRYGVSRMTIYRWKSMLSNGENGLKARKAPGRPPRINDAQRAAIIRLHRTQPADCWTQSLFCNALSDQLGIDYSSDHVGRIMHRLGLVPTKQKEDHA